MDRGRGGRYRGGRGGRYGDFGGRHHPTSSCQNGPWQEAPPEPASPAPGYQAGRRGGRNGDEGECSRGGRWRARGSDWRGGGAPSRGRQQTWVPASGRGGEERRIDAHSAVTAGGDGGSVVADSHQFRGWGRQGGINVHPEHSVQQQLANLQIGASPGTSVPPLSSKETPRRLPQETAPSPMQQFTYPPAQAETSSQGSSKGLAPSSSAKELAPPNRPAKGNAGRAVRVLANHFRVYWKRINIHQYHMEITPRISKEEARLLKGELTSRHCSEFGGKLLVYDGSKIIYSSGSLPFTQKEFSVVLPNEGAQGSANEGFKKKFKVMIKLAMIHDQSSLCEFLQGHDVTMPQKLVQALDVVFRENPSKYVTPIGRSFYTGDLGCKDLGDGLVGWNGYYQSIRPTMQGLILNVDFATAAFVESIPIIEFLKKRFRNFMPNKCISKEQYFMVKDALWGLKVQVKHRTTPRKYTICGLSPIATKDLSFPVEGGPEKRVVDYFIEAYNYNITFLELPCLQLKSSRITYLPMEVCKICEGQKFNGELTDIQRRNLIALACLRPPERQLTIKRIMDSPDGPGRGDFLPHFGMSVANQMTVLEARVLPAPLLRYGESGNVQEINPQQGEWNLLDSCVVEGSQVRHWAVVSFDSEIQMRAAEHFIGSLSRRCKEIGVELMPRTVVPPFLCRREDLEVSRLGRLLQDIHYKAQQAINSEHNGELGHLQLLVCIMRDRHHSYGHIKMICETKLGVITQCCLSKNFKSCTSQCLANLGLKINSKMGGRNVSLAVELPILFPKILGKPTIIFGADVNHPRSKDVTSPSVAAVVANIDWPAANRYAARVQVQGHREEIISNLKCMVKELWQAFCVNVGSFPEKVLFFRDGVSEGQFSAVLRDEVIVLKEALREIGGPNYNPLVTWVVVQKRHHTRLFPIDSNKDKSSNILPGTVVDTTITHPREFDFFLCSHAGRQGTSRPTHYHILWDENSFGSNDLQGLVYNLCYTYARCTRALSIVPPAHYAHLAAYRGRKYLDSVGNGSHSGSHRGGSSSRALPPATVSLPQILSVLQDSMYYC